MDRSTVSQTKPWKQCANEAGFMICPNRLPSWIFEPQILHSAVRFVWIYVPSRNRLNKLRKTLEHHGTGHRRPMKNIPFQLRRCHDFQNAICGSSLATATEAVIEKRTLVYIDSPHLLSVQDWMCNSMIWMSTEY